MVFDQGKTPPQCGWGFVYWLYYVNKRCLIQAFKTINEFLYEKGTYWQIARKNGVVAFCTEVNTNKKKRLSSEQESYLD